MALSSSSNQMSRRRKDRAVIQNFLCRADQVSIGYSATESVAPPSTGLSFFKLMTTVLAKRRQDWKVIFTDADDWSRYPGTEVGGTSSAGTGRATALQASVGPPKHSRTAVIKGRHNRDLGGSVNLACGRDFPKKSCQRFICHVADNKCSQNSCSKYVKIFTVLTVNLTLHVPNTWKIILPMPGLRALVRRVRRRLVLILIDMLLFLPSRHS